MLYVQFHAALWLFNGSTYGCFSSEAVSPLTKWKSYFVGTEKAPLKPKGAFDMVLLIRQMPNR